MKHKAYLATIAAALLMPSSALAQDQCSDGEGCFTLSSYSPRGISGPVPNLEITATFADNTTIEYSHPFIRQQTHIAKYPVFSRNKAKMTSLFIAAPYPGRGKPVLYKIDPSVHIGQKITCNAEFWGGIHWDTTCK